MQPSACPTALDLSGVTSLTPCGDVVMVHGLASGHGELVSFGEFERGADDSDFEGLQVSGGYDLTVSLIYGAAKVHSVSTRSSYATCARTRTFWTRQWRFFLRYGSTTLASNECSPERAVSASSRCTNPSVTISCWFLQFSQRSAELLTNARWEPT